MTFKQLERAEADIIARSSSLRLPDTNMFRAAEPDIQIPSDFRARFQDIKDVENGL